MKIKCEICGSPISRRNMSDEEGICFACAEINNCDDYEPDYGGACDGNNVYSDADPGL